VIFQNKPPIGLPDLLLRRIPRDTEDFIVVLQTQLYMGKVLDV
jgi:hypothetical protein